MLANIRDTTIYFDVEGMGLVPHGDTMIQKEVAFVVHGGPGFDHTVEKPDWTPLCDDVQLIYFDHRGHGRSGRCPRDTYTLDNNVEDMEALRRHLGLDKIVVIALSYGGMVALSYAVKYAQNVSRLILLSTASDYKFLNKAKELLTEKGSSQQLAVAERLFTGSFRSEDEVREYVQIMGPLYAVNFDPKAAEVRRRRAIVSVDPINEAFGGFLKTFDITANLGQIKAPTLVLTGRHDWICAPEFSEIIARKIPNASLKIFENSGHWLAADEHEELLCTIREFLPRAADQDYIPASQRNAIGSLGSRCKAFS